MADNKKFPAMLLYVSDFLGHDTVQEMTYEEVNLYLRLLMCCHQSNDDTIPDDPARLARKVRCTDLNAFLSCWPIVRTCFKEIDDKPGFLTHPRVTSEKEKARKRHQDGVDSAAKRWDGKEEGSKPPSKSATPGIKTNFVAENKAKEAAAAAAAKPRDPSGVQDRIDALLVGAGNSLRPFRGT